MGEACHRPVLLAEVLGFLEPERGGVFVDATLGLGGHALAVLARSPEVRLLGFDVDRDALALAERNLAGHRDRVTLVHAGFEELDRHLDRLSVGRVDGILFDLGVSSLQLDTPERGFSFRHDGPLDMRFSGEGMTAAALIASATEGELVQILREYGEEPRARRIARALVHARSRQPIATTGELRHLVARAVGGRHGKTDPATRTFQALRIAVNRELPRLQPSLERAIRRLCPGGRLAVIAFHSLEDRLVKQTLRRLSGRCVCRPGVGICGCRPEALLDVLTRRPVRPGETEVRENPRARSARLRAATRRPV